MCVCVHKQPENYRKCIREKTDGHTVSPINEREHGNEMREREGERERERGKERERGRDGGRQRMRELEGEGIFITPLLFVPLP